MRGLGTSIWMGIMPWLGTLPWMGTSPWMKQKTTLNTPNPKTATKTPMKPPQPHRSTPLPNHLQTVPPNGPSPAARGYSGSIQLPRPEAVSRERERRYGSSAGETRPCGCFCTDPWAEEGWRWVYCGKHQRIRQEEEDEEVEGGTTLPRDWDGDGKEPEPPRGRSRFRD
ncbi:hypothetical protein VC83_03063 [Pseudogymnoascus destructans]|uniref:Uncharacterized protein n=1 Tax=Pseudogymnoascus destructans TaxID=655981 RepID=A0A177AFH4_9PEZI|nr:uncharacterized protein VC83_03063 [Pseudogymnoascus destructans]OAF60162.1 hypothetical protein VC83_03063 [Pseudogymnoascus destructans]